MGFQKLVLGFALVLSFQVALAQQQTVTPDPLSQPAGVSQSVAIDLNYSAGDATLTGLGLRIHFDSSKVVFSSFSNVLSSPGFVTQGTPEADAGNQDGDPATDRIVLVAWADVGGGWPGSVPIRLCTLNFTTSAGFDAATSIRFTATSTAAGYSFSSTPAAVTLAEPGGDPSADLSATKSAPSPATVGSTITYQISVANAGPDLAQDVVLVDSLPGGVSFAAANPSQGLCSPAGGQVTCNLGHLAAGGSAQVSIQVTANSLGSVVNSVTVSSGTADPAAGNNTDTASTEVVESVESIPTLNEWGLILLLALLAGTGWWMQHRNRTA